MLCVGGGGRGGQRLNSTDRIHIPKDSRSLFLGSRQSLRPGVTHVGLWRSLLLLPLNSLLYC